jgi:hypothetical protein
MELLNELLRVLRKSLKPPANGSDTVFRWSGQTNAPQLVISQAVIAPGLAAGHMAHSMRHESNGRAENNSQDVVACSSNPTRLR